MSQNTNSWKGHRVEEQIGEPLLRVNCIQIMSDRLLLPNKNAEMF